jgi:hypothetical protein
MQFHSAASVGAALLGLLLAPHVGFAEVDCHQPFPEEARGRASMARATDADLAPVQENGITYVSGGVGLDERPAIARMSNGFNMKVSMRTPCGRAHIAPLRIEDGDGRTVLDIPAAGPTFLAKLPAGKYTVHVTPDDEAPLVRTVSVPASGQARLVLAVPAIDRSHAGDAPISW